MRETPTLPSPHPFAEPRALDEPRGGELDATVPRVEARRTLAALAPRPPRAVAASTTGLTKNEPALTESGSSGSRTIPLRAAQRDNRLAHGAAAEPRALRVDPERARQLGVAQRPQSLPRSNAKRTRVTI